MPYVITEACIGTKDRACVDVCPVDCIYEGPDQLFIHPDECIDCGACEPECPVTAIFPEEDVPGESEAVHPDQPGRFQERQPAGEAAEVARLTGASPSHSFAPNTSASAAYCMNVLISLRHASPQSCWPALALLRRARNPARRRLLVVEILLAEDRLEHAFLVRARSACTRSRTARSRRAGTTARPR